MRTYIEAGQLITGNDSVYDDGAVLTEDDRILAAGPAEDVNADGADREFNLPEHTVMPGIIDSHVHLGAGADLDIVRDTLRASQAERAVRALKNARKTVEAGITTVRDVASLDDTAIVARDEIAAGNFTGPRIFAVGNGLLPTGGHGLKTPWYWPDSVNELGRWRVADGVSDIRKAVREQIELGADWIKVWVTSSVNNPEDADLMKYSEEEIDALVEEANRNGVEVAADAQNARSIKACVRAGVRSIEHGMYMDEEAIEMMAENDVYYTLTRAFWQRFVGHDYFPDYYHEHAKKALADQREKISLAQEAGVKMAMGTDAGATVFPNGDSGAELVAIAEAGLSPLEAIEISTRQTAEMLEIKTGVLEEEFAADVIAVNGDPLSDIEVVAEPDNVEVVLADGNLVKDEI